MWFYTFTIRWSVCDYLLMGILERKKSVYTLEWPKIRRKRETTTAIVTKKRGSPDSHKNNGKWKWKCHCRNDTFTAKDDKILNLNVRFFLRFLTYYSLSLPSFSLSFPPLLSISFSPSFPFPIKLCQALCLSWHFVVYLTVLHAVVFVSFPIFDSYNKNPFFLFLFADRKSFHVVITRRNGCFS